MTAALGYTRERLAAARAAGSSFDAAWADALADVAAREWRDALEATRAEWRAAYEGTPAPAPLVALHAVAVDPDREPLPDPSAGCVLCGQPIPPARKRSARYCSYACQRAANGRAVAA